MARVRVTGVYALYDQTTGAHITPRPSEYFDSDDPLVQQHSWAFATDDELAAKSEEAPPDSVVIEAATKAPGEKRATKRAK